MIKVFKTQAFLKNAKMYSNETVHVNSVKIEMLPPAGKFAKATVDFGGSAPMNVDLHMLRLGYGMHC